MYEQQCQTIVALLIRENLKNYLVNRNKKLIIFAPKDYSKVLCHQYFRRLIVFKSNVLENFRYRKVIKKVNAKKKVGISI